MAIRYKKLWKLLIDKGMKKKFTARGRDQCGIRYKAR